MTAIYILSISILSEVNTMISGKRKPIETFPYDFWPVLCFIITINFS